MKEALTPSKRKQTTWNATEKEEVQLGAFDKILLECDQEKPVKFADILDSRYNTLFNELHQ